MDQIKTFDIAGHNVWATVLTTVDCSPFLDKLAPEVSCLYRRITSWNAEVRAGSHCLS